MSSIQPPSNMQVAEAIDWLVKFEADAVSAEDRFEFERWRSQSPQHELAWQRLGQASQFLVPVESMGSSYTMHSLDQAQRHLLEKRQTLKTFASVGVIGAGFWFSREYTGLASAGRQFYGRTLADISTAPGEQKRLVLADGGTLLLNTRSAINIDFNARPELDLVYGELSITNSGGAQLRAGASLISPTLGSEFTLIRHNDFCRVQVISGEVSCILAGESELLIGAGQKVKRENNQTRRGVVSHTHNLAWRDGFLTAVRMPLGAFVNQLARYRPGYLSCTPPIADLTLSGSFPLADTDLILDNLCRILPVRQQRFGNSWVRLIPV